MPHGQAPSWLAHSLAPENRERARAEAEVLVSEEPNNHGSSSPPTSLTSDEPPVRC
jgi:hypothetical protein